MKNSCSKTIYKAKFCISELFKEIKWQFIVLSVLIVVGIIVGIIFGFNHLTKDYVNDDFLTLFLKGNMASFSSLFYRFLSTALFIGILILLSLSKWLLPFGGMLLFYRAYLFGLNLAILLKFYGIVGIIVSIVIFPFQLLVLLYLAFFYLSLMFDKDTCVSQSKGKFILISIAIILIVNLVLSMVLFIFSPNVIFIL